MRFKVTVAYDGTNYQGFQSQTNGIGIQGIIEGVLEKIEKQPVTIFASGRTDKGVHAIAQVFHFDSSSRMKEKSWFRALNTYLPDDIRVLKVDIVKDDFHARHSALKKQYIYLLSKDYNLFSRNHEAFIGYDLDFNKMAEATKQLIGTHDFKGFAAYVEHKPTIKIMYEASVVETSTHYIFSFTANGFLKYMVRSLVGTIIDIGRGRKEVSVIEAILTTQDRQLAGKTASPEGLYLKEVIY